MIPFLADLNQRILMARSLTERGDLEARRAIYLSRMGNINAAREEVATLREQYGDGRYPEVSILIMLAEGLLYYFEDLSDRAHERVTRAYALGSAMQSGRCLPLIASWLAHLEFAASRYERVARLVDEHLSAAERTDPSALLRFCLVIADGFLHCGDRSSSQYWYSRARTLACSIGDRVSLGAAMYDRSAFGLSWRRVQLCARSSASDDIDPVLLRMEAMASYRYQEITGVTALSHLSMVSLAYAHFQCGDHQAALAILQPIVDALGNLEARTKVTSVEGELALCLIAVGRSEEAARLLGGFESSDFRHLDLDDQLVLVASMLRVAEYLGRTATTQRLEVESNELNDRYQSEIASLSRCLAPWRKSVDTGSAH